MARMSINEEIENIKKIDSIERLGKIIAGEQSDYWYDPCGKSGNDLNMRLTPAACAATRRIHFLMGLGKLG